MRDSNQTALEPFGQALLSYWRGNKSTELLHEFKNGQKKPLPVSVFFRSREEFLTTDRAIDIVEARFLLLVLEQGSMLLSLKNKVGRT